MTARKKQAASRAAPPSNNGFSLISEAKLMELYAGLLECRMFEGRIGGLMGRGALPANQRLRTGREAPAVGVTIDLDPEDTLAVCHGGPCASLVRGIPPKQLCAWLRSPAQNARRSAGSAPLKAAVQAAETAKAKTSRRIALVFCGAPGGKTHAQAAWREAMRRAGAEKLPMVFVRHIASDSKDRSLKAEHYGFPSMIVDGADVVAIYRVASEAIAHARRGNGPTLIECSFARVKGAPAGRRKPAGDPIANLENYLSWKGLFTANLKAEVAARVKRKLQAAQEVFALRGRAHG